MQVGLLSLRTFQAAFTECLCSRRQFYSHFHSMKIPSPVKAGRPRECSGCAICPLPGLCLLGLAQGEEEEEEELSLPWQEGVPLGQGRRLCAGGVGGCWGRIPCVHIKAQSCAHTCHRLQLLFLGIPPCLLPTERGTPAPSKSRGVRMT